MTPASVFVFAGAGASFCVPAALPLFDPMRDTIEDADPGLRAVAWPEPASTPGQVFKPHGSLPGELIVTADVLLAGLRDDWRQALADAVRGRTVVFVGYSGRDFDFQPLWDDILVEAGAVIWFDRPDDRPVEAERERARRRQVLRRCVERDALTVVESGNPSIDFVRWCHDNNLVVVPDSLTEALALPSGTRPGEVFHC